MLVSFKGKRYVHGTGSRCRNSMHHVHDGVHAPMLTTCEHGLDWQSQQDARCFMDMARYDRHDYDHLLNESIFCAVPRGRRLGSFRFLESIRRGCVPVVLSDEWMLPFGEIVDWSTCAVRVREVDILLVSTCICI